MKAIVTGLPARRSGQHALDAGVVAGAERRAGNHGRIGRGIKGNGRVGVDLGDRVAVVEIKLDGGGDDVLRRGHIEQKLAGDRVGVGPVEPGHAEDRFLAVGNQVDAVAAAGAAALRPQSRGSCAPAWRCPPWPTRRCGAQAGRKPLARAQQFKDRIILDAADHLGEGDESVAVYVDRMMAAAVVARQAARPVCPTSHRSPGVSPADRAGPLVRWS